MTNEEKVLPDPIEIEGIRIGDDRFKIKNKLDLNRKPESEIGYGSIARSPKKKNTDFSQDVDVESYSTEAIATGLGSIALGPQTKAFGNYSFSVGTGAQAIGEGSFCHSYGRDRSPIEAEIRSVAYGDGAASFGRSRAEGTLSFSEGIGEVRVSDADTKEGRDQSIYAHAEGFSIASGPCAHAEGCGSASGPCAHAEGGYYDKDFGYRRTVASGIGAHAEGDKTKATGVAAHAEGYSTIAFGYYCHAGGGWTQAGDIKKPWDKSVCCTAIGQYSKSTGDSSFSGGYISRAKGTNSFSFGAATVAQDDEQFVIGRANIPKNNCCFIIGGGSKAPNSEVWHSPETSSQPNMNITKNIVEIDWDGNLWINGTFSYGENKIPILSSSDLEIKLSGYYTKDESDNKFLTQEISNNRLLPSITEADNEKILMVVNGAWAASAITNAEGVAY